MQLDLKKLPFGQTVSRHLLFEEWDPMGKGYEKGCWLALASESSSMFGGVVERAAGTIRVQPTLDGAPAEFTAEATPALAVLKGEAGQAADAERAADYFVRAAAVGNPEAYAVLAWMAATGRTKRYESMHLAWLVREAKARGSKLIERMEQPQDTDVVRLAS